MGIILRVKNLKEHGEELLSEMNFTAPYSLLPYNLTPKEGLTVFSLLYGVQEYKEKVKFLLDEFDLTRLVDKILIFLFVPASVCLQ